MTDTKDPPIEPQDYLSGVKVIDIGDLRVARGLSRRPYTACKHIHLVYDKNERRIWCEDCETNIDAFEAFECIVNNLAKQNARNENRHKILLEAEADKLHIIAAKKMNEMWMSKKLVPCCPHCSKALFPEMFKNGAMMMSKELARQILNKVAK